MIIQGFDARGFEDFLKPNCDRLKFIQARLAEYSLDSAVLCLGGKKHLFVKFSSQCYNPMFKIKTVVAHYDRVLNTSGANDNSSGVFALLDFAKYLSLYRGAHNVRLIFTDGEEEGSQGVKEQGSFALAEHLLRSGLGNDDVYVIDSVGRGSVAILTKTQLSENTNSAFYKRFTSLYNRGKELLQKSCNSWIEFPAPFSDNAGFLAKGIPSIAITMLPKEEASDYANNLIRVKNLAAAVANRKVDDPKTPDYIYRESMPKTWRLFHTEFDNYLNLTPESFLVIQKVLRNLADEKIY